MLRSVLTLFIPKHTPNPCEKHLSFSDRLQWSYDIVHQEKDDLKLKSWSFVNIYCFVLLMFFTLKLFYFITLSMGHVRAHVWKSDNNIWKLVLPSITMGVLENELKPSDTASAFVYWAISLAPKNFISKAALGSQEYLKSLPIPQQPHLLAANPTGVAYVSMSPPCHILITPSPEFISGFTLDGAHCKDVYPPYKTQNSFTTHTKKSMLCSPVNLPCHHVLFSPHLPLLNQGCKRLFSAILIWRKRRERGK